MKYMGSKNRIAKDILPIILKDRKEKQWYVEPFCGGCNIIDKVKGNRIANDISPYLISLFRNLQNGWKPPISVSEIDYDEIKNNKDKYPDYLIGYIGFNLSYGAKWWGGYRRDKIGKRDYGKEAYNNIIKQTPNILNILFYNLEFDKLKIPNNSIIYCDPPYRGTTKYNTKMDYNCFYQWCIDKKLEGHQIFISEYDMPSDFKCVWSKEIVSSLTKNTGSKRGIEKLFTL